MKTDEKLKKRFAIYKINRKETKFFLFWLKKNEAEPWFCIYVVYNYMLCTLFFLENEFEIL